MPQMFILVEAVITKIGSCALGPTATFESMQPFTDAGIQERHILYRHDVPNTFHVSDMERCHIAVGRALIGVEHKEFTQVLLHFIHPLSSTVIVEASAAQVDCIRTRGSQLVIFDSLAPFLKAGISKQTMDKCPGYGGFVVHVPQNTSIPVGPVLISVTIDSNETYLSYVGQSLIETEDNDTATSSNAQTEDNDQNEESLSHPSAELCHTPIVNKPVPMDDSKKASIARELDRTPPAAPKKLATHPTTSIHTPESPSAPHREASGNRSDEERALRRELIRSFRDCTNAMLSLLEYKYK